MNYTALDPRTLSPGAQRALSPGPGRMMAARGLVPLPPAEQLAVLYQLSLEADVAEAARKTAADLPEKLVATTLTDPKTDPRVLDFFALLSIAQPNIVQAVALNPSVRDETIASLAAKGGAADIDLVAQNEQRLLRHPEIIAAMYLNRRARMSTVDRVVELAVRNNVRVPGLAAWDEVALALQHGNRDGGLGDAVFDSIMDSMVDDSPLTVGDADEAVDEEIQPSPEDVAKRKKPWEQMSLSERVRVAIVGDAYYRDIAIRSPIKVVAGAAIKGARLTDIEVRRYASNQSLVEDVIRYIAGARKWTKNYGVKVALCKNPKAPLTEVSKMMPLLHAKDIQKISKSRGVSAAVVAQARKLLMQRGGGKA
jgi:hypothetical protein